MATFWTLELYIVYCAIVGDVHLITDVFPAYQSTLVRNIQDGYRWSYRSGRTLLTVGWVFRWCSEQCLILRRTALPGCLSGCCCEPQHGGTQLRA
jgi:hypothetical protein